MNKCLPQNLYLASNFGLSSRNYSYHFSSSKTSTYLIIEDKNPLALPTGRQALKGNKTSICFNYHSTFYEYNY